MHDESFPARLLTAAKRERGLERLARTLAHEGTKHKTLLTLRREFEHLSDSDNERLRIATEECREWFEARLSQRTITGDSGFSIGGVGYGGVLAWPYLAFLRTLGYPDAARRFQRDLRSSDASHRLYALLGLSQVDKTAFRAALPAFLHSKETVWHQDGCVGREAKVAALATKIQRGAYQQALERRGKRLLF